MSAPDPANKSPNFGIVVTVVGRAIFSEIAKVLAEDDVRTFELRTDVVRALIGEVVIPRAFASSRRWPGSPGHVPARWVDIVE